MTFIKAAVLFVQIGLSDSSHSERPQENRRFRRRSLADLENALVTGIGNRIVVSANFKSQMIMAQTLRIRSASRRVGHGGIPITGLGIVALDTRGHTDIFVPGAVAFPRPPTGTLEPDVG